MNKTRTLVFLKKLIQYKILRTFIWFFIDWFATRTLASQTKSRIFL